MQETSDAWKYLAHYPIVEAILAIFTLVAAGAAIFRGGWDKKTGAGQHSHEGSSGWNQYTVHDALEILREIGEQNRERDRILNRIEDMMKATGKAQWEAVQSLKKIEETVSEKLHQEKLQTMWLEDIRNNQVMRGEGSVGIPRRK